MKVRNIKQNGAIIRIYVAKSRTRKQIIMGAVYRVQVFDI